MMAVTQAMSFMIFWVITAVEKINSRCPKLEFLLNIGNQLPGYTSQECGTALSYIGLLMNTWLNLRVLKKNGNCFSG
jgi:hypothetical protein